MALPLIILRPRCGAPKDRQRLDRIWRDLLPEDTALYSVLLGNVSGEDAERSCSDAEPDRNSSAAGAGLGGPDLSAGQGGKTAGTEFDSSAPLLIESSEALEQAIGRDILKNRKILFVISLDSCGINMEAWAMMAVLRRFPFSLEGSTAALVIDADSEFYTKDLARLMAFTMNQSGARFIGRPLVEGTGSLLNFKVIARNLGTDLYGAYKESIRDLIDRLTAFEPPVITGPKLLCIHASNRETSNTLSLWGKVRDSLDPAVDIKEVALRNGEIRDCNACHFDMCMYYSRRSSCFFGGTIVEEVYPALSECDAVIMLCPNYNDALGANMTALINRLTALYRNTPFSDKYLFAVIVSGYSGGDILAQQLIGSLTMNKAFILPPRFALIETANAPGSIEAVPDINEAARTFAERINGILIPQAVPQDTGTLPTPCGK